MKPRTLFEKIWDDHVVHRTDDGTCVLYIDRHLVHEVTSPQAFEGLRMAGRKVRKPEATLAVADHNVPTYDRSLPIKEEESRIQIETLSKNCAEFGITLFDMKDKRQGIVHIIGPEQGFTLYGVRWGANIDFSHVYATMGPHGVHYLMFVGDLTNDYLLRRESECREMAARATAPSVRKIHESLADRFAARAEAMKEEAA